MKVVAIIQARMLSSRLPGKVLLRAAGKSFIRHMIERVTRAKMINELWLATSDDASNNPLVEEVSDLDINVFRGSEQDVLSRFHYIAQKSKADWIVRLTGDCPAHDPVVIDDVISFAIASHGMFEYVSNALQPTYPDGLDVEVFTVNALEVAVREAVEASDKEHVTPLIHRYHHGGRGSKVGHYRAKADFSHIRLTLDEKEDYQVLKQVFEDLYPRDPLFSWLDVIALLTRKVDLLTKNAGIPRNEGYFSLFNRNSQDY